MTDKPDEDGPQTIAQTVETEADASTYREHITLTTHTLGLEPYVLIRAVPDGDDLRIKVDHNDTEGARGAPLAMLYVLNLSADDNPLTAAIKAVIDANPDRDEVVEVLTLFAEFCDIPMPS